MSEAGNGSAGRTPADPGGATADQGPKPPSWRALITGLLIALVMTTIMITTYVSAQHAVVARDLPWGVTGTSPLTTAVQQHVSLDIHQYSDQAALGDAANRAEIYGIGSNLWPLWGEFALMCAAVALFAATLQSLLGPIGTLLTVVVMVFFGNPSTGGVNGTAYLPAFWQAIGPGLPPWNGSTLIRNTLYFGGNSITQPLVVLSIYTVLGAALVTVLTYGRLLWWRGGKTPRSPISAEEEGGIATIPPA